MYCEDDLLMISALQHLAFCERQCALIHLEQQWAENRFTVLGDLLHEKVHRFESDVQGDCITARSLRLVSYELGLTGQADVVEFHRCKNQKEGIEISGKKGKWIPFPVEYKKGKPKVDNIDRVQLCAQAICLEEQLQISIYKGALFYGEKRRRQQVSLDSELRQETIRLTIKLHELLPFGKTPAPDYTKKCRSCSLYDICNPKLTGFIKRKKYEEILFAEDE